jgi:hypothetical protein
MDFKKRLRIISSKQRDLLDQWDSLCFFFTSQRPRRPHEVAAVYRDMSKMYRKMGKMITALKNRVRLQQALDNLADNSHGDFDALILPPRRLWPQGIRLPSGLAVLQTSNVLAGAAPAGVGLDVHSYYFNHSEDVSGLVTKIRAKGFGEDLLVDSRPGIVENRGWAFKSCGVIDNELHQWVCNTMYDCYQHMLAKRSLLSFFLRRKRRLHVHLRQRRTHGACVPNHGPAA